MREEEEGSPHEAGHTRPPPGLGGQPGLSPRSPALPESSNVYTAWRASVLAAEVHAGRAAGLGRHPVLPPGLAGRSGSRPAQGRRDRGHWPRPLSPWPGHGADSRRGPWAWACRCPALTSLGTRAFSGLGFEITAPSSPKGRRLFCVLASYPSASANAFLRVYRRELAWLKDPPPAFGGWRDGEGTSDQPGQERDSHRKGACPRSGQWGPGLALRCFGYDRAFTREGSESGSQGGPATCQV